MKILEVFLPLFFSLNWTPWASEKNLHQICFPAGDLQKFALKWSSPATFFFHWTELPAAADHEMKKCFFIFIFSLNSRQLRAKRKNLGQNHFFFIELNSRGLRAERKKKRFWNGLYRALPGRKKLLPLTLVSFELGSSVRGIEGCASSSKPEEQFRDF